MTSICEEAQAIVHGERMKLYGMPLAGYTRLAGIWSALLGVDVTPQQVALMMVAAKVSREWARHQRDNLVDMAGYAENIHLMYEELRNAKPGPADPAPTFGSATVLSGRAEPGVHGPDSRVAEEARAGVPRP